LQIKILLKELTYYEHQELCTFFETKPKESED